MSDAMKDSNTALHWTTMTPISSAHDFCSLRYPSNCGVRRATPNQ